MEIVKHITLRKKGQLTLPSEVRSALNLKEGSKLMTVVHDKRIILKPKIENPLDYAGMLGKINKDIKRVKDLVLRYKSV